MPKNINLGAYPPGSVLRIKSGTKQPQLWMFIFSDQSQIEFTLHIGSELTFTVGTHTPTIRIDEAKIDNLNGENVVRINKQD